MRKQSSQKEKASFSGYSRGKATQGKVISRSASPRKTLRERKEKEGERKRQGERRLRGAENRGASEKKPARSMETERGKGGSWSFSPEFPVLRVSVEREEQLPPVLSSERVSLVYLDEAAFSEKELLRFSRRIKESGRGLGIRLRRIERKESGYPGSKEVISLLQRETGVDAVLFRNMESLSLAASDFLPKETEKVFDYPIYAYNREALRMLSRLGAEAVTCPIELNLRELLELKPGYQELSLSTELLVYGYYPMMVSANCIEKTVAHCCHEDHILMLRDRRNKQMPVRMYCKYCYNQIFNAEPFSILDLREEILRLSPSRLRLDFSVESESRVNRILEGALPERMTRGHFHRGVE